MFWFVFGSIFLLKKRKKERSWMSFFFKRKSCICFSLRGLRHKNKLKLIMTLFTKSDLAHKQHCHQNLSFNSQWLHWLYYSYLPCLRWPWRANLALFVCLHCVCVWQSKLLSFLLSLSPGSPFLPPLLSF